MLHPASRAVIMAHDTPATPGAAHHLARDLWRVTAKNASALTGPGTNCYIIGDERLFIIDPGPDDPAHIHAIQRIVDGRPVDGIILTHAHRDHSDGARGVSALLQAPIMAFGDARTGRSAHMQALVLQGKLQEGDATDYALKPDVILSADQPLVLGRDHVHVIHTPGHLCHHISLKWRDILFTGDHIMAWSSTVVVAPDGDMAQYMESLQTLGHMFAQGPDIIGLPGHGNPVTSVTHRIAALYAHRKAREDAIRAAVAAGHTTLIDITEAVYPDLAPELVSFAQKSCHAHLISLIQAKIITEKTSPDAIVTYSLDQN